MYFMCQFFVLLALQSSAFVCGPGFSLIPASGEEDKFVAAGQNLVFSFTYSGSGYKVGPQNIIAGKSGSQGYFDGVGSAARFTDLTSMIVLPKSNEIVAADVKNNVLRKIDAVSKQVSTFAGVARSGVVADYVDGRGNVSTFSAVGRLSVSDGRVYVGVSPLRVVTFPVVFTSTLYQPYSLGTSDGVLSSPGIVSDTGRLTNSYTASVSPNGAFLILSDSSYHTIRRLDLIESRVSTIGGGSQGCLDAVGTNARFDTPGKTLITSNNSLVYIADTKNLAVRVMDLLTLQVWTLTGSCPPATKPDVVSGERISIAVQDMVISSDEKFLVVLSDAYGNLASIRIDTGFVSFLDQNAWQYMVFWQSLSIIPAKGSSCQLCSQGTYSPTGAVCLQCSVGKLCVAGSGNQTLCPEGYYCSNASSLLILPCEIGSFCPAGSSSHAPCPAGFHCPNTTARVECMQGSYCLMGSIDQTWCPAGYYCSDTLSKSKCEAGYVCFNGSTEQIICPAGFFCENPTSQSTCSLGSFCPNGSLTQTDCPSGSYCPAPDLHLTCPAWGICPTGSTAPIPRPNTSAFCDVGYAPKGGVHDIVLWIGKWGIQSMTYGGGMAMDKGGAVELIAGSETAFGKEDGIGGSARFSGLSSAVLLPGTTDFIVADRGNSMLRRVNYLTKNVTTLLGVIEVSGVAQNIDGVGAGASIRSPTYLGLAENSNLIYVSTPSGLRTVKFPGIRVESIPVHGLSFFSVKTVLSGDGRFYILTDYVTNLVHMLDMATLSFATAGGSINGCRDGVGSNALFDYPSSAVILSNGTRAFISDNFNHAIRILDTSSMEVSTLVAGVCPVSSSSSQVQSLGWVDGMVLSSNESVLLVLLTYTYSLSRVDLVSGMVTGIVASHSGNFMAGVNIALVPNVPPPCVVCDSGWVSLSGEACEVCPAGFVCSITSIKQECKNGSYCEQGSIIEISCPAGFFCTTPASKIQCTLGSFCAPGSTVPEICPSGYVCPNPSLKNECRNGSYCEQGSTTEISCPAGFFCTTPASKALCPLGSFCVTGSIVPVACPLGTFCFNGSSVPVVCPPGFVCPNPHLKQGCQKGSYCAVGSSVEIDCPAGFYCPNPDVKFGCPSGSYCVSGSVGFTNCPAGNLCMSNGVLKLCPAGSFCVAGESMVCPLLSTSEQGAKSQDECMCDSGYLKSVEDETCAAIKSDLGLIVGAAVGGVFLLAAVGKGAVWWFWGTRSGNVVSSIVRDVAKVRVKREYIKTLNKKYYVVLYF